MISQTTPTKAEACDDLRACLKITPKTADTLVRAGYTSTKQIAGASPDQIARQFGETLRLSSAHVASYRRAFRRIVWVSAQEQPQKCNAECKDWSNKALLSRGLWREHYDELTGWEIADLVRKLDEKPKQKASRSKADVKAEVRKAAKQDVEKDGKTYTKVQ